MNEDTKLMPSQPAEVTLRGLLSMQVCMPDSWTDEQAKEFADIQNPCGTTFGWQVRKEGSELLAGASERVKCSARNGCVHVMLDA